MEPTISMIIPVYNGEKFLDECLSSMANQTLSRDQYEIILVDDGSSDNSSQICKLYTDKYSNFHYYYKENGGTSSAINLGMKMSTGNYYAITGDDDYISDNYLEKLLNASIKDNADIVVCRAKRAFSNGRKPVSYVIGDQYTGTYTNAQDIIGTISYAQWGKIYKKELFEGIWFPVGITYEDLATIPAVMSKATKITFIDDELYYYRYNEDSILLSAQKNKKVHWDMLKAWDVLVQHSLSEKILIKDTILEQIYIRYILLSLCVSMIRCKDETVITVNDLVTRGYELFPDIRNYHEILKLTRDKEIILKLFLNRNYRFASAYILGMDKARYIAKRVYASASKKGRK